jgi:uncharacterized protein YraI
MNRLRDRRFPFWAVAGIATARVLLCAPPAYAEADGPDHFAVRGVAQGDVLNMRAEPSPHARKVGTIPPAATCVRNLGCQGGLSYQEFTTLSPAQRQQRLRENPRWCRVEYRGFQGWVAGRYLVEGSCAR